MTDRPRSNRCEFVIREHCISCKSDELSLLASGKFSEDPVKTFIEQDPWGVSPLPFLGDQDWEYVKCKNCSQMFHRKLLTPEWQEIRFSEWMSGEAIREFERTKQLDTPQRVFEKGVNFAKHVLRIERMTRSIRGVGPVSVLDFGCGWGEFLVMSKLFGFDAYGIERSPDRQEFLSKQGVTVFPDLDAAVEAVGPKIHAATLFQVLEHLDEPSEVLQALHEIMVPDAILVLEVPNCEGIEGIRNQSDYYNIHPLEHINCFTPDSLRYFAQQLGFEPEATVVAHVATSPLKVLKVEAKRLLKNILRPTTNQYFRRV